MRKLLDEFGRYYFNMGTSGISLSRTWQNLMYPLLQDAQTNRDGFLTDLQTVIADDNGGFATYGASRLVWDMFGSSCWNIPAALELIDGGIDFKLARNLPPGRFTGYEWRRLSERRTQTP
jgi:hypothetical protein